MGCSGMHVRLVVRPSWCFAASVPPAVVRLGAGGARGGPPAGGRGARAAAAAAAPPARAASCARGLSRGLAAARALALGDGVGVGLALPVPGVAPHAATNATSAVATTGTSGRNVTSVYLIYRNHLVSSRQGRWPFAVLGTVIYVRAAIAACVGGDDG